MPQQNGQAPYGNMAQPNGQPMYGNMPYPQQNPQGFPMQSAFPPNNGQMNMPPAVNGQQQSKEEAKKARKAAKKARNKKKWITLGIFTAIGLILGIAIFTLVDKYARQMTIIELPGAPIIASTGNNTVTADIDGDGEEDVIDLGSSLDLAQVTVQ